MSIFATSTYAMYVRNARGKAKIVFVNYDLARNYYARQAIKCKEQGVHLFVLKDYYSAT